MPKIKEPEPEVDQSNSLKYILRGHQEAISAVQLFSENLRLVSGDANGCVIIWDLVIKRPIVSWKPHGGAILEAKAFQFGSVAEIYTWVTYCLF